MPDKLTDAEIKKALECLEKDTNCGDCAVIKQCKGDCVFTKSLDLINRLEGENEKNENIIKIADKTIATLNAENESLKAEVERLQNAYKQCAWERDIFAEDMKEEIKKDCSYLMLDIKTIKAEACKEFAERLKNEIIGDTAYGCDTNQHSGYYDYQIKIGDIPEYINNLLNELVGDK